MSRLRFRLRTLLLLTAVVGGGLGWWFRPFVLEQHWPNGKLKSQLHVRRSWSGGLLTNGRQQWWWSNGQLARSGTSYGDPLSNDPSRITMPLEDDAAFDRQGRPLPLSDHAAPFTLALLWMGFYSETDSGWSYPDDAFPETPHEPP